MLKKKVIFQYLLPIVTILFYGCVKDVDFEQAENITLTPVLASSLVYGEIEASRFSDNGMELEEVTDSIANIEIFSDEFVVDNLVRVELTFEATNSINRTFGLQVEFLDETDALQHTFSFDVMPSESGEINITDYTEIFEDDSLNALKLSTQIVLKFRLYPSNDGSSLDQNSIGIVGLRSSGTYYLNLEL